MALFLLLPGMMRVGFLTILAMLAVCTFIPPVSAEPGGENAAAEETALRDIARQFVQKIGGKLKKIEEKQEALAAAGEDPAKNALTIIPDGQFLLFRPKLGRSVLAYDVGAIKQPAGIYYDLRDIIDVLELPIDYDADKQVGSGWFLREDWLIRFNIPQRNVVSRGEEFTISDTDIYEEDGDIYISDAALKNWFGLTFESNAAMQYVDIAGEYPLPLQARLAREKNVRGRSYINEAVLPRVEADDAWADLNTADIRQSVRVRKSPDAQTEVSHSNVTALEGQLLKHNAYALGTWNNERGIDSVRARLSQRDEDPELLGPLKARSYTIGDTDLPNLPLTGSESQEFGVRVSNNPLDNADFQSTVISGDSLPGWDVELYRDGILVDFVTVDNDARYEFDDVELFAGDNDFEVFFYGPQGEIRREALSLPVTPELLATQNNTYDVAVSLTDSQTYIKERSDDTDANTPHISARYNTFIGDSLAYVGARARQIEGEQKAFVGGGLTKIIGGTIVDLNVAADEELNAGTELTARRTINEWYLSGRLNAQTEEYTPEGGSNPRVLSAGAAVSKSFDSGLGGRATFTADGEYGQAANDDTFTSARVGLSQQLGRINLSNTTSYNNSEIQGSGTTERINNIFSARASMGKVFARAGVSYSFAPESQVDSYFSQINYRHSNALDTNLDLLYQPEDNFKQARLNLNYRHDKFRVTPFVEVDSDREVEAGITVGTSLVKNPNGLMPIATSERVTSRGMVSSFVYHDKNGNEIFDEGDEPLPGVILESINIRRRQPTDESGYALINNLPDTRATDIHLDPASFPDPFMISAYEGVSILPEPGKTVELVFPVHVAGEVDGTVGIMNERTGIIEGAMADIVLVPLDRKNSKTLSARAAQDGFYLVETIPPGRYLASVDPASLRQNAGGASPSILTIGYDGTVLSGQDFVLFEDQKQVPVKMKPVDAALLADGAPMMVLEIERKKKSKLASLLGALVSRQPDEQLLAGLQPLSLADESDYLLVPGGGWTEQYQRCQVLNNNYIPCSMVVLKPAADKDSVKSLLRTASK